MGCKHPNSTIGSLRFLTFNGNGLGTELKLHKVLRWCKRYKPDVVFLQETHFIDKRKSWYKNIWNEDWYHSGDSHNSRGASIMISKKLDYQVIESVIDENSRYVVLNVIIENKPYLLGNYYGPNIDCVEHLEEYFNLLIADNGQEIISAGDYNFVIDVYLDKKGGLPRTHEKMKNYLKTWCNINETMDIWRTKHPDTFDYTWKSWFKPHIYCRLDYFIVSNSLCNKTIDCCIKNSFMSDHRCVVLDISTDIIPRGTGFWKFNSSLLSDKAYVNTIRKTINDAIEENKGAEPPLLLDTLKCRVRGSSIKYCSYKKRMNKCKLEEWSNKHSYLQSKLPLEEDDKKQKVISDEIEELDYQIRTLIDETTKGSMMRSKCQGYEEGEKNSKYFYNLEKANGNRKCINKLNTDHGSITDIHEILKEEVSYYKNLYSSKIDSKNPVLREINMINFLDKAKGNISKESVNNLIEDITESEVYDILCSFADNKSPGTDGLSKEFYLCFWEEIKMPLLNSFHHSMKTGSLSMDQSKGILSLIPKKGKDTTYLKNWRPLTLLNTDYKILAKLFASRLKHTLLDFISSDQTGFVPNTYIGTNVNKILNFINHCQDHNIEGMLISIDYEKAFDSMEWDFLYRAMEHYGYPNKFINWIKMLYKNIGSCILNNGHISEVFNPTRGVRQGCPISPYLFIIGAEIMASFIRENNNIPTITNNENASVISQYADDTNIMTFRDVAILQEIFKCMDMFEVVSGLKINKSKTQVMLTGPNLSENYGIDNFCTLSSDIYVLGITVSCDKNKLITLNYVPVLDNIQQTLNIWSQRNLSLFGRIEVIKTLAVSKLIYIMSLLPSPSKAYIEDMERILFHFVWKNTTAKVRKKVLKSTKNMGGADMVDLKIKDTSLKLAWINKLISLDGNWKDYITSKIPISDLEYFFHSNLKFSDLPFRLPKNSFWSSVFEKWCNIGYRSIEFYDTYKEILSRNIWFNSNIKFNNSIIFWRQWYNKGVKTIGDIYNVNTRTFLSYKELVDKYGIKDNYLSLMSLISAIPKKWRRNLKLKDTNTIDFENEKLLDIVINYGKCSGIIYKSTVNDANEQPEERFNKWSNDVNMDTFDTDLDWYEHIVEWYRCTESIEIRSFIYKYNMRDLATRNHLFKIGKADNPQCLKCNQGIEDVLHMFWNCPTVNTLWFNIYVWLNKVLKTNQFVTKEQVLMNILNMDVSYLELYSFIHIICIKSLYNNRESCTQVNLIHIKNSLRMYERIERNIAIKNKKIQQHYNKWLNLYTLWIKDD